MLPSAPKLVKPGADAHRGDESGSEVPLASRWWALLNSTPPEAVDAFQILLLGARCREDAVQLANRDMAVRERRFKEWVEHRSLGGGGPHALSKAPIGRDDSTYQQVEDGRGSEDVAGSPDDGGAGARDAANRSFEPMDLGQEVTAL